MNCREPSIKPIKKENQNINKIEEKEITKNL
jgi:hypothetical protein